MNDSELHIKLERLRALLDAHGIQALRISKSGNLAWLCGGGDFLVSQIGAPVAEMLVYGGKLGVIANAIEAERLRAEELPEGFDLHVFDWFNPESKERLVENLTGGARLMTDGELDLYPARVPLLETELKIFRELGGRASRVLTDTLMKLEPGLSERKVSARVRFALEDEGMKTPVLLVAGEERFGKYRHPVPQDAAFGAVGLIVVCAQERGLIVSLSRTVAFGKIPEINRERLKAVLEVERAVYDATKPGTPMGEVFRAAQQAYAHVGFPEAWKEHHQGGPAGYFSRDFFVTPQEARPVQEDCTYAWNPSLPHAKSEDTMLVTAGGLENISFDPRWPSIEIGGRRRPDILVL